MSLHHGPGVKGQGSQPDPSSKDEADGTDLGVHSLSVAGHTLPRVGAGEGRSLGAVSI